MKRNVFVTGSSGGIGAAVVAQLADAGYSVIGFDTQSPSSQIPLSGFVAVDVADAAALSSAFEEACEQHGAPDHLVTCSGIIMTGRISDLRPDEVERAFAVNAFGVLNSIRAAVKVLNRRHLPSIVVISSNAAKVPRIGLAAYGASKAAAEMVARTAGLEYAAEGIRVNCVAPGSTNTSMLTAVVGAKAEEAAISGRQEDYRLGIPLHRVAQPADIARVVVFLLSDAARHITMESVTVDGGTTLGVD